MRTPRFFVNAKTRICQALSGPPAGADHLANIAQALKDGFVEVSGEELDIFRKNTARAIAAGWKPNGRTSYAKFMERQL